MDNEQPKPPDTPLLNKMLEIRPKSELLSTFLDWLRDQGIVLCKIQNCGDCYPHEQYMPTHESFDNLLHRFFEIDANAVEKERRALLEWVRPPQRRDVDGLIGKDDQAQPGGIIEPPKIP